MARRTPQRFNSIDLADGRNVIVPEGATRSEARIIIAEQLREQRANRERAERRRQRCTEETCSHDYREGDDERTNIIQFAIEASGTLAVAAIIVAVIRKLTRHGE